MTPSGIEPATFRFVAQHFNHWATAVPEREYKLTYFPGSYLAESKILFHVGKTYSVHTHTHTRTK